MISIDYSKIDFKMGCDARTLRPEYIGTHSNGWTIAGEIIEDYYEWVDYFEATNVNGDFVKGDFEGDIQATSQKVLDNFLKKFPYEEWDTGDI